MRKIILVFAAALVVGAPAASYAASGKAAAATKTKAAYSVEDTDLGTLLDDPASKAIIKKFAPTIIDHPQVGMARPLTLAQLQRFSGETLNDGVLAKIDAALKAAAPK